MISQAYAESQLERIAGLKGFNFLPAGALNELRLAIQAAKTEPVADRAIGSILASTDQVPAPADIRRAVWELNDQVPDTGAKCDICGGTTFVSSYWLVTHENGFVRREKLPFKDPGAYMDFLRKMRAVPVVAGSPRQEVLSASAPCICKPKRVDEPEPPRRRSGKLQKAG